VFFHLYLAQPMTYHEKDDASKHRHPKVQRPDIDNRPPQFVRQDVSRGKPNPA
jgi:hypothetical protein